MAASTPSARKPAAKRAAPPGSDRNTARQSARAPKRARQAPAPAAPPVAPPSTRSTGNVHLYVGISLDGYIAAPDGGVDWLNPYADAHGGFDPFIRTIKACVMGRATWDHALAKYGAGGGRFGMPTYVVTHRPLEAKSPKVKAFNGDLRELVTSMRRDHPGGDFWLMGGGNLARGFLDDDLVDILSLGFVPTLLGAGLLMFPPSAFRERRLRLVKQHTYPSGVIELRYERA